MAPARFLRLISNVMAPGSAVRSASQIEVWPGSFETLSPLASERRVSSKCSGSTAQTAVCGEASLTATEMPLDRPPPPQHDDSVEADVQRLRLPHQLQPDRALAGNDGRIVEGRHQHHALLDIGADDSHAIVLVAVERHHLGAHLADIAHLERRRVDGHGNDRLDAEHGGRSGDTLGVIAGRERNDAAAALFFG